MEPISAAIGAGNAARTLFEGLLDRWVRAKNANMDAAAVVRLLLLEARRNREILNVAVGAKESLPASALWRVPLVMQSDLLEFVLGQGEVANKALVAVRKAKPSDAADDQDGVDFLTNIYVRMVALQGLASLNQQEGLSEVRIELRLKNLRADLSQLIRVLSQQGVD